MSECNEYRCEACGLFFSTDLRPDEAFHCLGCGHLGIEAVTVNPLVEYDEGAIIEEEVTREVRALFGLTS